MKNIFLLLSILTLSSYGQIDFEKENLHYVDGNEWYASVYSNSTFTIPAKGTSNHSWNLSLFPSAESLDTMEVSVSGGATTVSFKNDNFAPRTMSSNDTDYVVNSTEVSGMAVNGLYLGLSLPHRLNKSEIGGSVTPLGNISSNIEVIATGSVTLSSGTYDAWMVKEYYSLVTPITTIEQTYYFIQTKEEGRVAILINPNGSNYGKLLLLDDNNFSSSNTVNDIGLDQVKMYPNPASDILSIETASEIESVQITSLTGATVLSRIINSNKANLDISSLSKGIYVVNIYQGDKVSTQKITVK